MPDLTAKQQGFALSVLSGMSQADAYRANYNATNMTPGTIWSEASVTAAIPKVRAMIAGAQEQKIESCLWTIEKALKEIEINIQGARAAQQFGPARASVRDAAELSGLWKEKKSESDVPIIKQTIILQARPAPPGLPTIDAEYQVLEPSEPTDTVESPDC